MEQKNMNPIDLSKGKHQLITVPIILLAFLFSAGFLAKEKVATVFGLVTHAQADEDKREIKQDIEELVAVVGEVQTVQTEHIIEFRVANSFQMISAANTELKNHMLDELNTPGWLATKDKLESRLQLSIDYKNCILNNRPNCNLLQRQLWQ